MKPAVSLGVDDFNFASLVVVNILVGDTKMRTNKLMLHNFPTPPLPALLKREFKAIGEDDGNQNMPSFETSFGGAVNGYAVWTRSTRSAEIRTVIDQMGMEAACMSLDDECPVEAFLTLMDAGLVFTYDDVLVKKGQVVRHFESLDELTDTDVALTLTPDNAPGFSLTKQDILNVRIPRSGSVFLCGDIIFEFFEMRSVFAESRWKWT